MSQEPTLTRRELFRTLLRWGAAAGAMGLGMALTRKDGETCTNQRACASCGRFEACGLPQALAAKAAPRKP